MITHWQNHMLSDHINNLRLHVRASGYAIIDHDPDWTGSVVNPPFSRLYYILQGEFFIVGKDGKTKTLTAGNCYLLPTGYSFDYGCSKYMKQVYFHIKLCDFDEIDLLKHCKEPLSFPFSNEQIKNYLSMIKSQNIIESLNVQQTIYESVFTLIKKYRILPKKAVYSPQIQAAIEYIREHLSMQLDINEIAANTHTAVSTLTRKFKQETGLTISQYIDESVMFQAEQLLFLGHLTIQEISEQLGFCDQFYFTRKFKEKFLVPPREYRKLTII